LPVFTVACSGTLKLPAWATTPGWIGSSTRRTFSTPRLRTTRNRADSGSQTINTTASNNGNTPPNSSKECQP
jgi:hypothetical protein